MTDLQDTDTGQESARQDHDGEDVSFARWLIELVALLLVAFLLATGIKTWVVQPFYIPSGSMEPTLLVGDRVLVNKFLYRLHSPRPGDVVVLLAPGTNSTDYIKRVVAVGGQTVQVRNGKVYVDGKLKKELYVNKETPDNFSNMPATLVPEGDVFVMGDNRAFSKDSRVFGPQPVSRVLGKAFAIYWPIGRIRGL